MLGDPTVQTTFLAITNLWDLVPDDHILKQVEAILDLSWLRDEVGDCYHPTLGRTAIAPEIALRLMLAAHFLGEVKDRALMRRAQTDLAIRAFARLGLTETVPDHSSLTRIRQRWGAAVFLRVFVRAVRACQAAGLVSGRLLHSDPTLVRADVSWASLEDVEADAVTQATRMLEENAEETDDVPPRPTTKRKKRSRTDPDATLATAQKHRPMEPCYKVHHVVDSQAGVVVDVAVTTGEASAGPRLAATVKQVTATLGAPPAVWTADTESASAANYAYGEAQGLTLVIPHPQVPRRPGRPSGARRAQARAHRRRRPQRIPARRFRYDPVHHLVRCPCRQWLYPSHRDARGWVYRSDPRVCGRCPCRARCYAPSAHARTIHIVDDYAAWVRARREKERGWPREKRAAYRSHRHRVEGVQGEAKEQHGLRRAVRRGLDNMTIQAALTATVINLKRLARAHVARLRRQWWRWGGRAVAILGDDLASPGGSGPAVVGRQRVEGLRRVNRGDFSVFMAFSTPRYSPLFR